MNEKSKRRTIKRGVGRFFHLTLSVVVGVTMISCLPDPLEVNSIPKVKPEIVVSSQIVPDESLLILLTKTIGALDASNDSDPEDLIEQIAVNDAIVIISGEENVDTLNFLDNGLYGGVAIPFSIGEEYELKVISESLGAVSAKAVVQAQVNFETISAELYYNGYDDTLAQVTYTLQDPAANNFYMINVQEVEQEDAIANLINPRAFTKLYDDKEFNGNEFGEIFRVFPRDYKPGDTIAVSLANISKPYYDFMKLRIDNRFSFVEFLGEPVNYPTNVQGGRGFFNLYVPDIRLFILE
jgi:hypothetical protein